MNDKPLRIYVAGRISKNDWRSKIGGGVCTDHEFTPEELLKSGFPERPTSRDKARDRFLQAKGWKVFRFTGSEVFRSAPNYVTEVLNAIGSVA